MPLIDAIRTPLLTKYIKLKIRENLISKKSNLSSYTRPIASIAQAERRNITEKIFLTFMLKIFDTSEDRNKQTNSGHCV